MHLLHGRSSGGPTDDSTDPSQGLAALHHAFSTVYDRSNNFPFVVGASKDVSVADKHPAPIQIFQLWQTYLNNVDPLLRITHNPTLQKQIIDSSAHFDKVSKDMEALMFNIYLIAMTSLTDDEAQSMLGEEKPRLLAKFHEVAQQTLVNADFMCTSSLMVLQAYVLYLV